MSALSRAALALGATAALSGLPIAAAHAEAPNTVSPIVISVVQTVDGTQLHNAAYISGAATVEPARVTPHCWEWP